VKCKYVTRNTRNGRKNEYNTGSYESIAGGLDHVDHVIRLPIEHGISMGTRVDNIMDGININDLTIEQYVRLIQENQTPIMVKKVDDMTIVEYIEYEEKMKRIIYEYLKLANPGGSLCQSK
nr:hypothetical protein [Tanacetum cinerariifolium]